MKAYLEVFYFHSRNFQRYVKKRKKEVVKLIVRGEFFEENNSKSNQQNVSCSANDTGVNNSGKIRTLSPKIHVIPAPLASHF